jgi:hypothetical protein
MSVIAQIGTNAHIVIYFGDGFVVESINNLGVFETCNCLDVDDPKYHEYYACVVAVSKIVQNPQGPYDEEIKIGGLIEISELNEPLRVETSDGKTVWSKK